MLCYICHIPSVPKWLSYPPPGSFMSQKGQIFIDFLDVEKTVKESDMSNNFYINKINKHLIFLGHKTPGGRTITLGQKEYYCASFMSREAC